MRAAMLALVLLLAGLSEAQETVAPKATVTAHTVNLTWNFPAGASASWYYRVYKSTKSGVFVNPQATVKVNYWTDKNVTSGKTYYYVVTTYDLKTKTESPRSNQATAIIP